MVISLLSVLTLSVLQLGLALHIRNTVLDAAAEGARYAALADNTLPDGATRTRDLIRAALGPAYATDVEASCGQYAGHRSTQVQVVAPFPLIGLIGPGGGLAVVGHAAVETLGAG
jgi:hypothetical protein